MKIKNDLFCHDDKVLALDAARKLIRAAFPALVTKHLIRVKKGKEKISPTVDWKSLFNNEAIIAYLIEYIGDIPDGLCFGINTITMKYVTFYTKENDALTLTYPPRRIPIKDIAKIEKLDRELTEEQKDFIKRYYGGN